MAYLAARVKAPASPSDDAWSIIGANAKDFARVTVDSTFSEADAVVTGQVVDHLGSGVDFPGSYMVGSAITLHNNNGLINRYGAGQSYTAVHTDGMNFHLIGARDNNYVSVNASTGDFLDQRIVNGDISLGAAEAYWPISGDNSGAGGKEQLGAATTDLFNWTATDWQILEWNNDLSRLEWHQELDVPLRGRPLHQVEQLIILAINGGLGDGGRF